MRRMRAEATWRRGKEEKKRMGDEQKGRRRDGEKKRRKEEVMRLIACTRRLYPAQRG